MVGQGAVAEGGAVEVGGLGRGEGGENEVPEPVGPDSKGRIGGAEQPGGIGLAGVEVEQLLGHGGISGQQGFGGFDPGRVVGQGLGALQGHAGAGIGGKFGWGEVGN